MKYLVSTIDNRPHYSLRLKAKHMKAVVCYEFGKPLVTEEVELDPPKTGEVTVKIGATAICHSDLILVRDDWGGKPPIVAGHETDGFIAEDYYRLRGWE